MLSTLKVAARSLLKTPGFSVTAMITLGLCLAANVAIFAVVDAVVLRALPFPHAEQLVTMGNFYPHAGGSRSNLDLTSLPNYYDRRSALKSFSSMATSYVETTTVSQGDEPTRVLDMDISPDFFRTLGVPLAMGREFTDAEMVRGANNVAILTHEYWRDHFGADPQVLGKQFRNDGVAVTVVGVLPPNFRYLSKHPAFFRPLAHSAADVSPQKRHSNNFNAVARLAPGVTLAQAQSEVDAFNAAQLKDDPDRDLVVQAGYQTWVDGLRDNHIGEVKPMLLILQAGVGLLLLIGAVNLANLFLIRATNRTKELAVRKALGATRGHLISEVLAETFLVGAAGGVLGVLLGALSVRLLGILGTDALPLGADIRFDGRVAAAALAAALVTSALLAIPASWFGIHGGVAAGLRAESRGGTANPTVQRLRHLFIVVQVALAFVLLSGAGLLAVSLRHVLERPPGFRPANLYAANFNLPRLGYAKPQAQESFAWRLMGAVAALPGVSRVGLSTSLPFGVSSYNNVISVLDNPTHAPLRAHSIMSVTGDLWATLRIPLIRGRFFTDDEVRQKRKVVVVDQAFASRYWPGMDPIGKVISNSATGDPAQAYTIVGVAGTIKQHSLTEPGDYGAVYFPYLSAGFGGSNFSLVIESAVPAAALTPMVRQALHGIDPGIPLTDLDSMADRIAQTLVSRRSPAILAGVFAGVALLLAAVGTFGVLRYAVSQRQHEIGIRMALGAQPAQIRDQFLTLGLRILGFGAAAGVLGAWMAGRSMQAILFNVPALQPLALIGTLLIIGAVTLGACLYPAYAASRVDPLVALREE